MLGDNESVINTATQPRGKLHKRWVALSYHCVREAVASGIIRLHHCKGTNNPSDILSKHWDYASIWATLKPVLFWEGDTAVLAKDVSLTSGQDDMSKEATT